MTEKQIGQITHVFNKISVGIIELTDTLKLGDKIHVKGAHDDFTQAIDSMQIEHEKVEIANSGDSVGIKFNSSVHINDKVFKTIDE